MSDIDEIATQSPLTANVVDFDEIRNARSVHLNGVLDGTIDRLEDATSVEDALPEPKIFGAGIVCIVCGAQPYPCCELVRQDFDLHRFNLNGVLSASPKKGFWYCREHSPKRRREASALLL
jgi:hypothetical protein